MESSITELHKDLEELKKFSDTAVRPKIKDWLSIYIRKIETEISTLKPRDESDKPVPTTSVMKQPPGTYTVQLTTYGFDQSDKFVKLYLTSLSGVQNIAVTNIHSEFKDRSVWVKIDNLDGKNYELNITKLLHSIDPSSSSVRVKTDCVLIMLKKAKVGESWNCVTLQEQIQKERKKPNYNKPAAGAGDDPNAGLMNIMKQMYEEGDDDMKRTIAKAWTEARDKQGPGDMPGMDDM